MPTKMLSNLSQRPQRKKQTRLAFDAVASSSSTTLSPARIRYELASSQPKAFNLTLPEKPADSELDNALLPGNEYAVVLGTSRRKTKNGKIPFKPLATLLGSSQTHAETTTSTVSSEADTSESDIDIAPSSRRQRMPRFAPTFMSSHKKTRPMGYDGAEDFSSAELSSEIEKQVQSTRLRSGRAGSKQTAKRSATPPADDTGDESPLESPVRASVKRGQVIVRKSQSEPEVKIDQPKVKATRSFIAGGNSYNAPVNMKFTPSKSRRSSSKSTPRSSKADQETVITLSDGDDNYDDELTTSQGSTMIGIRKKPNAPNEEFDDALPDLPTLLSSASRRIKNTVTFAEPIKIDSDDESEDVITRSSPKQRISVNVEDDEGEDEDEPIISSQNKRRRSMILDDSETDELASPSKRFRSEEKTRGGKGVSETMRITRKQQRKKPHRTERERRLELLRRQRAGEKITELTSSESDDVQAQALYDSNSELEVLSEFEDEEKDDQLQQVRESLRSLNRNDDDDDFVVDDDDEPLGVPGYGLNDIPLEFTHHAHKRLIEHFKDAIEWMVQNKINPGFDRKDAVYVQAFKKVDVEVRGYADSKYMSASWNAPFIRALNARPEFYVEALGPGDDNQGRKCDACGRSNHPATYQIQLGGKAYHKNTLDEVDNDREEGGDDDDASIDSNGEPIPDVQTSWYVGRFCKGNAETAHRLKHWKFALNEWVVGTLKSEGHLQPQKLAQREDWSKKKRSEYANTVVDAWWENNEIKGLYRDFKNNLEAAREGKTGRWRNQ